MYITIMDMVIQGAVRRENRLVNPFWLYNGKCRSMVFGLCVEVVTDV